MNTAGSVLVDTTVVVGYFRGETELLARFAEADPLLIPWIVLGELHFGARRAHRSNEQLAFIRDLLMYAVLLFPDERTTEHYAQMKAELFQVGRPIPDNDLWIAALARQYDLPLATRDVHFTEIRELRTLAW